MSLSIKYGIFTGIIISVVLFLFQLAGSDFSPGLKLGALLPIPIFIFILFNAVKSSGGEIFPGGVAKAITLSAIAGITVVVCNLLLFLINREYAFSKYSIIPENIEYFATISVILFFEILVAGVIMGFIAMQAMKGSSKVE